MSIRIETGIPIKINDVTFRIDTSDEAVKKLLDIENQVNLQIQAKDYITLLIEQKEKIKEIINMVFMGKPFDTFYEVCGYSTAACIDAFNAAMEMAKDEIIKSM